MTGNDKSKVLCDSFSQITVFVIQNWNRGSKEVIPKPLLQKEKRPAWEQNYFVPGNPHKEIPLRGICPAHVLSPFPPLWKLPPSTAGGPLKPCLYQWNEQHRARCHLPGSRWVVKQILPPRNRALLRLGPWQGGFQLRTQEAWGVEGPSGLSPWTEVCKRNRRVQAAERGNGSWYPRKSYNEVQQGSREGTELPLTPVTCQTLVLKPSLGSALLYFLPLASKIALHFPKVCLFL